MGPHVKILLSATGATSILIVCATGPAIAATTDLVADPLFCVETSSRFTPPFLGIIKKEANSTPKIGISYSAGRYSFKNATSPLLPVSKKELYKITAPDNYNYIFSSPEAFRIAGLTFGCYRAMYRFDIGLTF